MDKMIVEAISSLKESHHIDFRFFDVGVCIYSDSETFLELFSKMYNRFQNSVAVPSPHLEVALFVNNDNPWGSPVLVLEDGVFPLDGSWYIEGYAYEQILYYILSMVRSHFLIHSGAVSFSGKGTILVGDSGYGKTTLVLELVRRGFKFLSDEIAAIERIDRKLDPFPRSLRIRPDTLGKVGFNPPTGKAFLWLDKLLVDIEEIKPNCLGQAVSISNIVFLKDSEGDVLFSSRNETQEVILALNRLEQGLLRTIKGIDAIDRINIVRTRRYPMLHIWTEHRTQVVDRIQQICDRNGILILDIIKRTENKPKFINDPQLSGIPNGDATMLLLRHFQGSHKSALLKGIFDGSTTRMYMELATTISQARCYTLSIGPLNETADLIEHILETG